MLILFLGEWLQVLRMVSVYFVLRGMVEGIADG